MGKYFKRIAPAKLFVVLLLALLVACSGQGNNNGQTNGVSQGDTDQSSDSGDMVTVRVLGTAGTQDKMIERYAEDLKKEGIRIEGSFYGYDEYFTKQQLAMTKDGGQFDVIFLPGIVAQTWGQAGALHPMDDFMKEYNYELDDYYDSAKQYAKVDGSWILIPYSAESMVYYYRKDLYEEAGLEPPKTMKEMASMCSDLTGDGTYGLAIPAGQGEIASTYWSYLFWSYGGEYFNDKMVPQFNTDTAIDSAKFFAETLNNCAPQGVNSWTNNEAIAAFSSGSVAAIVSWPAYYSQIADPTKSNVSDKFAVAPVPAGPTGEAIPRFGMWGIGVTKNAENVEAAEKVVKILSDKEAETVWAKNYISSARKSVNSNPEVIEENPVVPFSDATVNLARQRPSMPEVNKTVGDHISAIVSGQDAKETMDALQKEVEKIIGN